jgi:hypothetical protein
MPAFNNRFYLHLLPTFRAYVKTSLGIAAGLVVQEWKCTTSTLSAVTQREKRMMMMIITIITLVTCDFCYSTIRLSICLFIHPPKRGGASIHNSTFLLSHFFISVTFPSFFIWFFTLLSSFFLLCYFPFPIDIRMLCLDSLSVFTSSLPLLRSLLIL